MRLAKPLAFLAAAGLAAACVPTGANYIPVVDGPVNAQFQSDLAACQSIAAQQGALAPGAGLTALAGAGVAAAGTAVFANEGTNVRDAAILGAAAGLTSGALDQQRRKEALIRSCMRGRGHNVIQ